MGCFGFASRGVKQPKRKPGGCSSCCCGWSHRSARHKDESEGFHEETREGLDDIIKGYHKIAKSGCSPHAAQFIGNVRKCIQELEMAAASGKGVPLNSQSGSLPLPEEQEDWEAVYPEGGYLLRRHLCMASLGDNDWSMGNFFMSDLGLAFDTGDITGEGLPLNTGFLFWNSFKSIRRSNPSSGSLNTEVTLSLVIARTDFSKLHIQLRTEDDVNWLMEFWDLQHGDVQRNQMGGKKGLHSNTRQLAGMGEQYEEASFWLSCCSSRKAEPMEAKDRMSLPPPASQKYPDMKRQPSILAQRRNSMNQGASGSNSLPTLERTVTSAFVDTPNGPPVASIPQSGDPIYESVITDLTLASIHSALRKEDCMQRFLKDCANASSLECTPWTKSTRLPGTLVRKIVCRVPCSLPLPETLKSMIAIPESSLLTEVFQLRAEGNTVVQTSQYCTHDIPYGENFRIQEIIAFQALPSGEVEFKKWCEVIWVAPLPWLLTPFKPFMDSQTRVQLTGTTPYLFPILYDLA